MKLMTKKYYDMKTVYEIISILIVTTSFSYSQEPAPNPSTDADKNWVSTINYNIYGETLGKGVAFYNEGGKPIENQIWDIISEKVWTSKIFYDQYNRVALTTFQAPQTSFGINNNFIRDASGGFFNIVDYDLETTVEEPNAISNTSILGAYYSNNNSDNPYQDITSYPYVKNVYSKMNPEKPLRVLGSNKMENEWKNSYSFTMPITNELGDAFDDTAYNVNNLKAFKTVTRDVHGIETVVFTDLEGKVLASARSGNEENQQQAVNTRAISVKEELFVDIHLPVGLSGITIYNPDPSNLIAKIYDLITEEEVFTAHSSLPAGLYRIFFKKGSYDYVYNVDDPIVVLYKENYYDYALNYYNKANQIIASKQPLNGLESTYKHDSAGRIIESTSPDEGTSKFKYRKDGQIRYSQNSKQLALNEFSYTEYGPLGRPIESGVIVSSAFSGLDPDGALPSGARKEQNKTEYDFVDTSELETLGINSEYYNPSFLSGNVAKTSNDYNTTYYSYDIYGRLKWIVQSIEGFDGAQTINYEYDNSKSVVSKTIYQKHNSNELFVHKYTYSDDNLLLTVETSKDNINFLEQASYEYYDNKSLKRTVLGDDIQGIDYVYNINGQLKAINHQGLNATQDPGGDTNDLFGMTLDYYSGDYQRSAAFQTPSPSENVNQYNGNISAIAWNTDPALNQDAVQYKYQYNKNNWLTEANFYGTGYNPSDYQVSNITYDANGNIQSLKRNKDSEGGTNLMDDLTYHYDTENNKPNQLSRIEDAVTVATNANDIKNQPTLNNYKYNSIGQLEKNTEEALEYVYNAAGLVTEVKKNEITRVKFYYNDRNHRVKKESYTPSGVVSTYYVRDLSGNPLGIYSNNTLKELPIYGLDRIGVHFKENNQSAYQLTDHLGNVRAVLMEIEGDGRMAYNNFEESLSPWVANHKAIDVYLEEGMMKVISKEHLGGVDGYFNLKEKKDYKISIDVLKTNFKQPLEFSIWKGKKMIYSELVPKNGRFETKFVAPVDGTYRINFRLNNEKYLGEQIYFYLDNFELIAYNTEILALTNRTDYYPFGMPMPNRNEEDGSYRYKFQGQEKDSETGMEAFELRLWDGRIGRWLTIDPAGQYASPYLGMGNNPISRWDPDGGCDQPDSDCGFFKKLWFRTKGDGYLVDWWKSINEENEHVNWNTFFKSEELGVAASSGSYLVEDSDGTLQEVQVNNVFTTNKIDYGALAEASGEFLMEEVLERFIPLPPFIDGFLPIDSDSPFGGENVIVASGKKPGNLVDPKIWKALNRYAGLKDEIIQAFKNGFVRQKGERGIKYLKDYKHTDGITYAYEIKLTSKQFGGFRFYGNKIHHNVHGEILYFSQSKFGKK